MYSSLGTRVQSSAGRYPRASKYSSSPPGVSFRWRIDLQVATPALAAKAVEAYVERADTHAEGWSDHAPVTAVFDLDQPADSPR